MNFHQRATHKEVRVHTRAKWRICRKYPFISSWLTGACGGGEPKSVLVCSEASANHTWPLPSTLANERWPLGAICCELLQSQQQQRTVPGQEHRNTSARGRAVSTGGRSELKEVNWKPDSSRWLSRFSKLKKNKKQNTNYVSSQIFPCFVDGAAGEFNLDRILTAEQKPRRKHRSQLTIWL